MARFNFRLQKLYEYRLKQEQWAKDAYAQARGRRLQAEEEIERITARIRKAALWSRTDVTQRIVIQTYMERCEDDLRAAQSALAVLEQEEDQRREEWLKAKQDAQALEKLRDKAFAEWLYEENRREQNEMDEHAVMRRAA